MRRINTMLFGVAAALALSAAAAPAQTIGFKLGASIASQKFDPDVADFKSLTGFVGGGLIRFGSGRLGIQLEALSVTKGSKAETPTGAEGETRLEYVEIPLLLHLPLTTGGSFAPYIVAGPSLGFEISCTTQGPGSGEADCDETNPDRDKKIDFGVGGGLGVAFAAGPGAVLLEGRYTLGLSNIATEGSTVEIKNRTILIMAGYEIPLGRR